MAAPVHEHPKLPAMAVSSLTGQDFAAMLHRAIARSGINSGGVKQIELQAEPEPESDNGR